MDSKDSLTGLPIISLYGDNKKPKPEQLLNVDVILFDIQDVGARFYTYISTLHYVMEACAENKKTLVVLDRPNPHGNYIDGPVLDMKFSSFVGMHPVPIVHGMTIAEYAQMINGQGWLAQKKKCNLKVIPMEGWTHDMPYKLPIPPSPNLPTMESVYLYPSLCLFEGTDVSVGRGTDWPFEVVGKPGFGSGNFEFTPRSIPGKSENPPYKGQLCKGYRLTKFADEYVKISRRLYLFSLVGFHAKSADKDKFFTPFFDKLAGTDQLRKQIQSGLQPDDIQDSWQPALREYKKMRAKYLLYKDYTTEFEGR